MKRFDAISKEIEEYQTIPGIYWEDLEKRLVITCKTLKRYPRSSTKRARPLINPKACEGFKVAQFCKGHKKERHYRLNDDNKKLLEDIADRNGLNQSSHYLDLMEILFPKGNYTPLSSSHAVKHY
ncbi:hypothetical protein EK21DRAFT_77831 [Setomelanomma holmii]|uniref:Uncharacterized protein n=1 Tax=Setomelanomma holmii TaxID=210430 RepID=A0A9P4H096_9PLEO|nr:hypothetical protein EK21DRAFT_77831 [Setomelanomma holmii]